MLRSLQFKRVARRYCLLLLSVWLGGCGGGSSTPIVVPPAPVPKPSVIIIPKTALVPLGTSQPFYVVVGGTTNNAVTWSASAGTIDDSGNYQAPASLTSNSTANVTVSLAADDTVSATAVVTLSTQPVALTVGPASAVAKAGMTADFQAKVTGTTNTQVQWTVTNIGNDTSYPGSIQNGIYRAPSPLFGENTYQITAISSADPSKTASALVTSIPLENQVQQHLPISLGSSGVNAEAGDCCSGTLGSLLVDDKGKQYILSNNHVLGRLGHAAVGELVVQPGFVDTLCDTTAATPVATFTKAAPITGNIDAALAEVEPGAVDPRGGIIGLGGVNADGSYITAPPANTVAAAAAGMGVAKSGRTTGISCGMVVAIDATVQIDYQPECGNPAALSTIFRGETVVNDIVKPGDSGSLLVEAATARPLGLIAGLSLDGQYGTANPASEVLSTLGSDIGAKLSFVGGAQHAVSCVPAAGAKPSAQVFSAQPSTLRDTELRRALATRTKYEAVIMREPAVVAFGVGHSQKDPAHAALLVFVDRERKIPLLPAELDGIPVQMLLTTKFGPGTLHPRSCASATRGHLPSAD